MFYSIGRGGHIINIYQYSIHDGVYYIIIYTEGTAIAYLY